MKQTILTLILSAVCAAPAGGEEVFLADIAVEQPGAGSR